MCYFVSWTFKNYQEIVKKHYLSYFVLIIAQNQTNVDITSFWSVWRFSKIDQSMHIQPSV